MPIRNRAKILIVDDTPAKAAALEATLAPLRQTVVTAGSGREALRLLLREEFALILLDVRMSDMDGYETAALIRQRKISEHTPIIFLTAFDRAELDMVRGYSLGAVDFIFSPIVPEVLRAKAAVFVELYQKTEEVRELFAAAQESNRSKSEFLNMAAHELRTPLSVISGYLALLAEGSLGPAPHTWQMPLDMLSAKAGELNRIVDDLLLASRMDVGTVPEKLQVVDLRELARAAAERARPRSVLLEADLAVKIGPEPIPVEADPSHIGRILDNLINNALTYCTEKPVVTITVGDPEHPTVVVRDNGIGIPPDKREAVFDRFVRLDDPELGPVPGTGLGLYISRQLALRHGGSLELGPEQPEAGSLFVLSLPSLPRAGDEPAEAKTAGRPRLRVHRSAPPAESDDDQRSATSATARSSPL